MNLKNYLFERNIPEYRSKKNNYCPLLIFRKRKKKKNFKIASIIERADELNKLKKGGGGREGEGGQGQKLDPKKTSRSLTTIKRSDGDICVNKANSPGGVRSGREVPRTRLSSFNHRFYLVNKTIIPVLALDEREYRPFHPPSIPPASFKLPPSFPSPTPPPCSPSPRPGWNCCTVHPPGAFDQKCNLHPFMSRDWNICELIRATGLSSAIIRGPPFLIHLPRRGFQAPTFLTILPLFDSKISPLPHFTEDWIQLSPRKPFHPASRAADPPRIEPRGWSPFSKRIAWFSSLI